MNLSLVVSALAGIGPYLWNMPQFIDATPHPINHSRVSGVAKAKRDARPGGKADAVDRALLLDDEATVRRHHLDGVAGLDGLGGPVGEQAVLDRADADLQLAPGGEAAARAADGIAAAHVLAIDGGAQGEELAGLEGEAVLRLVGDGQGDRHRAGRLGADALDGEIVESES